MGETEEKDPQWKPGDLEPLQPVQITLDSAKEVATGESKYGTWNLWTATVENQKVYERDGKKEIAKNNYSGKVVFFPSEKLHEQLLELTNGTQEGVKVQIQMVPKKNKRGSLYTSYEATLVEGGNTPPNNLLYSHNNFLKDFKKYVEGRLFKGTEEDFIGLATGGTYGMSQEDAKKLWVVYNEDKKV